MAMQIDQLTKAGPDLDGEETITPANYDPLMGAHWAIAANVGNFLADAGRHAAALYLLGGGPDDPEDPVEIPGYEGRTWPRCPLCYIGLAHEVSCTDERCSLPKVDGYAWMIDRAADDAVEKARELGLLPETAGG